MNDITKTNEIRYLNQTGYHKYCTRCRAVKYLNINENRNFMRAVFKKIQVDVVCAERATYINGSTPGSSKTSFKDLVTQDEHIVELTSKDGKEKKYIATVLFKHEFEDITESLRSYQVLAKQSGSKYIKEEKGEVLASQYEGTRESGKKAFPITDYVFGDYLSTVDAIELDRYSRSPHRLAVQWDVTLEGCRTLFSNPAQDPATPEDKYDDGARTCMPFFPVTLEVGDWIVMDSQGDLLCVRGSAWGKYKNGDSFEEYTPNHPAESDTSIDDLAPRTIRPEQNISSKQSGESLASELTKLLNEIKDAIPKRTAHEERILDHPASADLSKFTGALSPALRAIVANKDLKEFEVTGRVHKETGEVDVVVNVKLARSTPKEVVEKVGACVVHLVNKYLSDYVVKITVEGV